MIILLLALAAAPAPVQPLPDIELGISLRAKSVRIEQKGEARLAVHADPDAGSAVETRSEPKGGGRTELKNVSVEIRARTLLADPAVASLPAATPPRD